MQRITDPAAESRELPLPEPTICWVIVKAREFEAKEAQTDPASGSNPTDDDMQEVLQDSADDPVATELRRVLDGLSAEEQAGLAAMAWLGRGEGGIGEWPELLAEARRRHEQPTGAYLLGMPLLADHLESALEAFGGSCAETEADRL